MDHQSPLLFFQGSAFLPGRAAIRCSPTDSVDFYGRLVARDYYVSRLPSVRREPMGPPEFHSISLPACHGLKTPADLSILTRNGCFCVAFGSDKTLGVRISLISKLYQHFRGRDTPYGLQDSLSTLHPSCSPAFLPTPPQVQDSIRMGG